jgi:hypothetical protein
MGAGGRERGSREIGTFTQRLRVVFCDPRIMAKIVAVVVGLFLVGKLLLPEGWRFGFVTFLGSPLLAVLARHDVARARERLAKEREERAPE